MTPSDERPPLTRWKRLRARIAYRINPYWTQEQVDAVRWRAHAQWLDLGFGVCHSVDAICPGAASDRYAHVTDSNNPQGE